MNRIQQQIHRHSIDGSPVPESGAIWRPDGAEAVEMATPVHAIMFREEDLATDDGYLRADAFRLFLEYCFADGPHPAQVMRRVYLLAFAIEPTLCSALARADCQQSVDASPAAHFWRVQQVVRGTRISRKDPKLHDERIVATLQAAATKRYLRTGYVVRAPNLELNVLLDAGEPVMLCDYERRLAAIRKLLEFAFYFGPTPGKVTRRLYSMAKWRQSNSALLLDMTLHQLGLIFGETRAAWSWRVKRVINRFLAEREVRGRKASFQKSASACERYSEVQRGNRNRLGGISRVA